MVKHNPGFFTPQVPVPPAFFCPSFAFGGFFRCCMRYLVPAAKGGYGTTTTPVKSDRDGAPSTWAEARQARHRQKRLAFRRSCRQNINIVQLWEFSFWWWIVCRFLSSNICRFTSVVSSFSLGFTWFFEQTFVCFWIIFFWIFFWCLCILVRISLLSLKKCK